MWYVLIVLISLVVFAAGLLLVPVLVKARYSGEEEKVFLSVHYLFFKITLLPPKEDKKKKPKKPDKSKKSKGKSAKKKPKKKKSISEIIHIVKLILENIWEIVKEIIVNTTVRELSLSVNVAGKDAAETAIVYGYANSVIYPLVALFVNNARKVRTYNVNINPDFSDEGEADVSFSLVLSISPLRFISVLFRKISYMKKLLEALGKIINK